MQPVDAVTGHGRGAVEDRSERTHGSRRLLLDDANPGQRDPHLRIVELVLAELSEGLLHPLCFAQSRERRINQRRIIIASTWPGPSLLASRSPASSFSRAASLKSVA
jgi:hypothetical protein